MEYDGGPTQQEFYASLEEFERANESLAEEANAPRELDAMGYGDLLDELDDKLEKLADATELGPEEILALARRVADIKLELRSREV